MKYCQKLFAYLLLFFVRLRKQNPSSSRGEGLVLIHQSFKEKQRFAIFLKGRKRAIINENDIKSGRLLVSPTYFMLRMQQF